MPRVSLITHILALIAGLVFASWGWKSYINIQKLEALEKVEAARIEERERNEKLAQKHAEDLFAVLDHYRKHPVTVRLPSVTCPGGSTVNPDVAPENIVFTVGKRNPDQPKAVD